MTPTSEEVVRTVLELRIHGVNNTSPQSMLDVPEYVLEQVRGDKLGSFWRAKPHLLAEIDEGEPGYTPPHVLREAYSWGGMARNSPGATGGGVPATVWNVAARISWALLLPFGIANVAYWTRRLGGKGAARARLFGLGLTVLIMITTCEVALDLIAAQCYANGTKVCTNLPVWFDILEKKPIATRIGYASVLPLALLLVLWQVSRLSGVRYEQKTVEHSAAEAQPDERSDRILALPTIWRGAKMLRGLVRLHLAAGFAVVVLASSWAAVFGTGEGTKCRQPADLVTNACRTQVSNAPDNDEWIFGLITVWALLVVLAAAMILWWRTDDRPDLATSDDKKCPNRLTWIVFVAAVLLLAAHGWALFGRQPEIAQSAKATDGAAAAVQPLSLPGINAAPTIVVAILLGLALSALTWRTPWRTRASNWLVLPLGAAVTFGLLATARWQLWVVVAVLAAVALVGLAARYRDTDQRFTAWAGMAPGVVLGIALLTAMILSTMVVVGAGGWLNGGHSAADLAYCTRSSGTDPHLCVPRAYVWFGAAWVVAVVVLLVVAFLLIVVWLVYRLRGEQLPAAFGCQVEAGTCESMRPRVWRARHRAALAHRAEKVAAVLGVLGLAAAFVAVFGSATGPGPLQSIGWLPEWGDKLAFWGLVCSAVTGLAVVSAFAGGRLFGSSRPLGLAWDLICFLPRAAHPFGPPCYAERAVPEILDRCHEWLCDPAPKNRIVVLSAHSLGAVLAVATLFAMPRQHLPAVRLITYGTQLRAYFGRIFPELLGPAVLETPACTAARLISVDPWRDNSAEATADTAGEEGQPSDSVRSLLPTDRWCNLWRRTDYLGFPVHGYVAQGNPIDRAAQEFVADKLLTHGGYPGTSAYQQTLTQMIDQVSPSD